ncbi:phospholipid-binding lipoprotein MlaA [Ferrimonas sediminum]|uniref:Phospholipid-binding lipoprotein MlaA n=2 Tax=Ferrimonas sediminum TaxID=718193 RepID=A0A1G8YYK0_9GAMM|nr:phospholipid-binding lipoprotein MlaA [Ferrimonas sediminum]
MNKFLKLGLPLSAIISMAWLAMVPQAVMAEEAMPEPQESDYHDPRDPWEPFNRAMWDFNYNVLDKYLFRPAVYLYIDYVPQGAQLGVENFLKNFDEPYSAVNNLLQGKGKWAANAAGRFVINTTLGIGGVFDVARNMGLERKQDEFGEVLGYWGVADGPYIMLPVFGPTTVRDEVGDFVDKLYFPYANFALWQTAAHWALDGLSTRAKLVDQESILDNSLDPYVFVKEGYYQYIAYNLYDGNPPIQEEDDDLLEEYLDEIE